MMQTKGTIYEMETKDIGKILDGIKARLVNNQIDTFGVVVDDDNEEHKQMIENYEQEPEVLDPRYFKNKTYIFSLKESGAVITIEC